MEELFFGSEERIVVNWLCAEAAMHVSVITADALNRNRNEYPKFISVPPFG
jgi:hypothetical protein